MYGLTGTPDKVCNKRRSECYDRIYSRPFRALCESYGSRCPITFSNDGRFAAGIHSRKPMCLWLQGKRAVASGNLILNAANFSLYNDFATDFVWRSKCEEY